MSITISPGWATYLRVSDEDKQTPERSFAMQRQSIQENLLASSDLSFKREYRDMLTGTTPNRHDYQLLLAEAEAGGYSHLGLYRADRFGRNAAEGLQAATKLIGLGIKIRVANMPSLTPETPDGFFMFLIQMGLAQREVDVLKQRTHDGMKTKMLGGGWAQRAPDGYVNKERQVKSNKYERWVEQDPLHGPVLREAWDLLLTSRYTLVQICEELANRGHVRQGGKPWAWTDPKTGRRETAYRRLHRIFHNPFFAGWCVSERFGIAYGEVRGRWEPLVTTQEYEQGLEILRQHDHKKVRKQRHFYLLRGLLWLQANGRNYKMYCTTPSGKRRSYSYYNTRARVQGKKVHIPCGSIDKQISQLLNCIDVDREMLPRIREAYSNDVREKSREGLEANISERKRRISELRQEEAKLGRLFITDKISEETYNQLRLEWREKIQTAERLLEDIKRDTENYLDDLDAALVLLSCLSGLYERLEDSKKSLILQIIINRLTVNVEGEIIDCDLNSPFSYLRQLADNESAAKSNQKCSTWFRLGAQHSRAPITRRSSASSTSGVPEGPQWDTS